MANLSQLKRQKMMEFLAKIKEEHKDDDEALIALGEIERELNAKKYGLVWEEHEEEVDVKMRSHIPVFTEDKSMEINAAEGEGYNFLLEGDNLHSLKLLEKTHKGKIDVIYIDPPYNTKKKDFVYDDKRIGEEDGFKHSKWLSFMYYRLNALKTLLSQKGVIFISIDDNEQANLKLLCDEIFSESNFIAMAIHKNNSSKNQAKFISVSTEYILIYANNMSYLKSLYPKDGDGWKIEKKGAYDINKKYLELKKAGFSLNEISEAIKDMYKIPKYSHLSRWNKVNDVGVFKDADLSRANGPKNYTIVNPETGEDCVIPERGWGKSYEELLRLQKENLIWYGDPKTPPGMISYITGDDYVVPDSFWYFDNSVDTKMLRKMFGSDVFNNPKPLEMIKQILEISAYNDAIVLDAFAGSGTTGHAVLDINRECGGDRHFILCTNNEGNICEQVTYARIKTVITGKCLDGSVFSKMIPANLKYYRTDFISKDEEYISEELLEHIIEMIQLEHGINIDSKNYIMITSDEEADELVEHWDEYKDLKALYVSKDVLFTTEQNLLFKNIDIFIIPDYYFNFELKEVGETW